MHVKPVRYQDRRCLHFITFSGCRRKPPLDMLAAKETFEAELERVLAEKPEDWKWSSFVHYATGTEGIVEIESQWTARR